MRKRHVFAILALVFSGTSEAAATDPFPFRGKVECTTKVVPLCTLSGHPGDVHRIAVSPNGKWIAAVSARKVFLWDRETQKKRWSFKEHNGQISDLAFSPDSKSLATAAHWDSTVHRWDVETGRKIQDFEWKYLVSQEVSKVEDGILIVGKTHGWKYRSMNRVVFSPDGKTLAIPGYVVFQVSLFGKGGDDQVEVRLWDISTGRSKATLQEYKKDIVRIAYRPDGKRLAAANKDGTVIVWELKTGKRILDFQASPYPVYQLAFSPDGKQLATAGDGGEIRIWNVMQLMNRDAKKGTITPERTAGIDSGVTSLKTNVAAIWCLQWSPDGNYLVSSAWQADRTDESTFITIWNLKTGKEAVNFGNYKNGYPGADACFDREGKILATAHDGGTVKVWDFPMLVKNSR